MKKLRVEAYFWSGADSRKHLKRKYLSANARVKNRERKSNPGCETVEVSNYLEFNSLIAESRTKHRYCASVKRPPPSEQT